MIFKQKISKEEKFKLGLTMTCVIIPIVLIFLLIAIDGLKAEDVFAFMMLFLPMILLILLLVVKELEWYYIYCDHIEVRNIFGVRNSVYYNNVNFIEEVTIDLMTKGMKKTFYIFHDGRKNNNNILDINSCYNKKKYNLRIYKTPELEEFITNHLKIEIKNSK